MTKPCESFRSIYARTIFGLARACRHEPLTDELRQRCDLYEAERAAYEKDLAARKLPRDPFWSTQKLLLRLDVEVPGPAPKTKPADCKVGICYRIKEPYVINYWMDNSRFYKLVELPNKSPLISIDLERAFLVKKVQEFEFDDDGFLSKVTIDKKSELLAAASIPLAVVTTIADAIPLQTKIYTQKKNLLEKEAALAQARARLRAVGSSGLESGRPGAGPPGRRRAAASSSLGTD